MKPSSVGSGLPATALPARIAALTCEPIDAPTERVSVLKPVASPVCAGGTASTIRFAIAANASPMPVDMTNAPRDHGELRAVVERRAPSRPGARDRRAERERQLGAEAGAERARDRAGEQHHRARPGSISRPAPVASRPKP